MNITNKQFKYFSTFSGIGAPELAIKEVMPNSVCVGFSEIEPRAISIYEKHFDHKNFGDITSIDTSDLPDFDCFIGGFPCQAFSIAGKRGGFSDTRGTLFFHIARILKDKKPQLALLENVRGLLNHDGGRTFEVILKTLDELGYDAEWKVLDAIHFGAAPRPRVFILAVLRNGETDVREGDKQAFSLHASFCEGLRSADDTARNEEIRRGSERIIRAFAKLPDWLDSWDSVYGEEAVPGELDERKRNEVNF